MFDFITFIKCNGKGFIVYLNLKLDITTSFGLNVGLVKWILTLCTIINTVDVFIKPVNAD